jgi:hypothetical protein
MTLPSIYETRNGVKGEVDWWWPVLRQIGDEPNCGGGLS